MKDLLDVVKTLYATANSVIGINKSIIEKNKSVSTYLGELSNEINCSIARLEAIKDDEPVSEDWFRKCISLFSVVYQYIGFIDGFLIGKY